MGDANSPTYFSDGKPVVCNYKIYTTVPADAKFTDTIYTLPNAGTNLGGVKSGGDVSITKGIITINDNSHNHTVSNITDLEANYAKLENGKIPESYLPSYVDDVLEGYYDAT